MAAFICTIFFKIYYLIVGIMMDVYDVTYIMTVRQDWAAFESRQHATSHHHEQSCRPIDKSVGLTVSGFLVYPITAYFQWGPLN